MMDPLSDAEIDELDSFLMSDLVSDESMVMDSLDGYLTAIAIGPTTLVPSQWLPGVWGSGEEHAPEFESMAQAQRIFDLIMRHMNGIIGTFEHDPDSFDPMFSTMTYPGDPHEYLNGEMWAYGFMQGVALCQKDWQPLFDDAQGIEALRPLRLLGADGVPPEEESLIRWPKQREELSGQIPASFAMIYRFWLPYREAVHQRELATVRRSGPKIGRNDPCPCGSGKKFKNCCGAAAPLH